MSYKQVLTLIIVAGSLLAVAVIGSSFAEHGVYTVKGVEHGKYVTKTNRFTGQAYVQVGLDWHEIKN
jgi:hypothetical protein